MPAQSQQQQKLFGLALAFKRGEVPSSEVSDEIKAIADRMSEKEIEDFAATKHKGLPKMKEQLRKIVREIMRERAISEIELSKAEMDKLHSDGEVEVDGEKVTYDESVNEVDTKKANLLRNNMPGYVGPKFAKKASDEDLIAMADLKDEHARIYNRYLKDINDKISKLQKKYRIKESVNEGPSTEEKRIAMLAVRKQAKYRNVNLEQAIQDQINALMDLQRDVKKGKKIK